MVVVVMRGIARHGCNCPAHVDDIRGIDDVVVLVVDEIGIADSRVQKLALPTRIVRVY